MNPSNQLRDIIDLARRAGAELMRFYEQSYDIRNKSNNTPVTDADMASDKLIHTFLREHFPHPILSEETADSAARLSAEYVWIVDPLDGTRDFIRGTGEFSVIIGLAHQGKPVLGVTYLPVQDAVYYAELDSGAFRQIGTKGPEQMRVSPTQKIEDMTATVGRASIHSLTYKLAGDLDVRRIDRVNSVGVKLAHIAEGSADVYINATQHASEWDTCGAEIIVSEAGGIITDLYGHPLKYNLSDVKHHHGLLASNALSHSILVERIAPFLPEHDISMPN